VQTFSFWVRPAIFAVLWVLAAALTLSELATVNPALESAGGPPPRVHFVRRSAGAGSHAPARMAIAP
jgi:hypothetical protein